MAFVHGRSAAIHFNGVDLSPYLHSAGLDVSVGNADSTTFANDGWRTNMAGQAAATASFDGYQDAALDAHLQAALRVDGGVLTVCPGGGSAIGRLARLIPVTATGLGEAPTTDAVSPFSWAVASQGYIGFGWVLHPHGEDTNTTTGATRDDAAATSTGWTAHLHVTAVDGGSWVVKLEDSANGSAWADVTGGTFAAKTAAGGERLQSAALTTTLRRYVRYTATRTGGTTGDGITFALAYTRDRAQ